MKYCLFIFCLFITACSHNKPLDDYSHYLRNKNIQPPTLQSFSHCYDYGCKTVKRVSLNEKEWSQITSLFKPKPKTSEAERTQISKAIQAFETIVGQKTGTHQDKRGTFRLYEDKNEKYDRFQQDCVDESTNTTLYLALLNNNGLLQFHRPTQPQSRQPLFGGNIWWHQTATIRDIKTSQQYGVDSWFEDNGARAYIVPIEEWFKDWKPFRKP